jgi:hypothetical protein
MTNTDTQDGFAIIRELAALANTEGVNQVLKDKANGEIDKILTKVIMPAIQLLTAKSTGLRI